MFISSLKMLLGLLLLYGGAEGLIRGSVSLAIRFNISRLVIGLTIVAFATSSPEMVVGLKAALAGQGDITAGNMVGSNICNLGLILALAALIRPISVRQQLIRRETPFMIGASVLTVLLLANGLLGRFEGFLLFGLFITFVTVSIRLARRHEATAPAAYAGEIKQTRSAAVDIVLVAGGIFVLSWGADLLVAGAVDVATRLGVSKAVIALTMVALGTSLPELAAAVVASLKNEGDIVMGNVIGSNLFNVLGVLGLSALLKPLQAPGIAWVDLGVMLFTAVIVWPILRSGRKVGRIEGSVLLVTYIGYMLSLTTR